MVTVLAVALLVIGGCQSSPPSRSYEDALSYWGKLPYPRLEKLMDRHGSEKVDSAWVHPNAYEWKDVVFTDLNESEFPSVIEIHTDTSGVPTVNLIYRRQMTRKGEVTRKARITAVGQLQWEHEYLNQNLHGYCWNWYANGAVKRVDRFVGGESHGAGFTYSPDRRILQRRTFRRNQLIEVWQKDDDGKWRKVVSQGNGGISYFDDAGTEAGFAIYANGEYVRGGH